MTRHSLHNIAGLIVTGALLLPAGVHSESSQGGAFRSPGYGARAWSMGGAAVASVDDESAVFWNPAFLGRVKGNILGVSYVNLVSGTSSRQSQLAYTHAFEWTDDSGDRTAMHAIGAMYTNVHLDIAESDNYTENTLRGAYAFTPDHFISVGVAIELLFSSSSVENFGAKGSTVDAALRLDLTEHTTFGLSFRDVVSRYSYDDAADFQKRRGVQAGLAARPWKTLLIEGDLWWEHGSLSRAILGADSGYMAGVLAVRVGLAALRSGESRSVLYAGLGVQAIGEKLHLHYNANLDNADAFADTHRFTLSYTLK